MLKAILLSFCAIFSAVTIFFGLDGSLRDWDEAVYAQVSRENTVHSDWMNLRWNGQPWIDKPPLMIWATAIVYNLFGVGEWQARISSAVLCWLSILLVLAWGSQTGSVYTGIIGALILLGTPHFIRVGKMGQLDVPVAFFITASLYFFYHGRKKNWCYLLSGLFTGCAVMTKWTVGLYAPIIQAVLMLFSPYRATFRSLWWWLGHLVCIAFCAPWVLYQVSHNGDLFIAHFMFAKTVAFVDSPVCGHGGPLFFYLTLMFRKSRPWVFLFFPAVGYLLWLYKRNKDENALFLSVWAIIVLGLFSVATTKLHWYIMPAYPALALGTGYCITRVVQKEKIRAGIIAAAVCVVAGHMLFSRGYISLDLNPEAKSLCALIRRDFPETKEVVVFQGTSFPSIRFYSDQKVFYCVQDRKLRSFIQELERPLLLLSAPEYDARIRSVLQSIGQKPSVARMVSDEYVVYNFP
ncbi:MAG: glycosyltransferase family 39 protein [Candidatus Auribacterota bacterium]